MGQAHVRGGYVMALAVRNKGARSIGRVWCEGAVRRESGAILRQRVHHEMETDYEGADGFEA
jgi:hypothetical protein